MEQHRSGKTVKDIVLWCSVSVHSTFNSACWRGNCCPSSHCDCWIHLVSPKATNPGSKASNRCIVSMPRNTKDLTNHHSTGCDSGDCHVVTGNTPSRS